MDPQTLQMMAQALMSGGGQPKPQPMQSGTGGMYGMPSAQGGGMLGSSPYQSISPVEWEAILAGEPIRTSFSSRIRAMRGCSSGRTT